MDTTLARPPIGQLLDGRYRVESHLAHGGMATVYLGTDTRLDRTVALKIMHAELANDEDFVRRFVAEARSVARLSHPNVVTVYDQGADGRTLYLAMEYVPGHTLRDLLRERGRLSPREALDIMDGVLAGLAAAHHAGIAHRDVKPENVLLGDRQAVKVADFGLARMLSGVSHTKSGMLIGTAAYLAPEQVAGRIADARSDVYSAGVMLFEMLTGLQPHTGESPLAVAYKHVNEVVPPPSAAIPGLPPALDTLVALATSRDPDLRPADAGQFLHAISGVRNGLPLPSLPPPGQQLPAGPAGHSGAGARPAGQAATGGPPAMADAPTVWPAPTGWPAGPHGGPEPAGDPVFDLIPGMAPPPPARQSFGSPRPGAAATQQFGPEPARPGVHRTLIVAGGDHPFGPGRGAYQPPGEPRLQRLLFSRRLGYLAAALVVVLIAGVLGWWLTAGRYTTVPTLAGATASVASADLRNAGLAVTTGKALLDNQVPKGEVIRTIPGAGARVPRGGHVTLVMSAGPHMITVPQVTGQQAAAAEHTLKAAGLVIGKVADTTSTTIPAGIVISTRPSAGVSWPQPKPVILVVSAGQPVPNFVGGPQSNAQAWAQANGVQLNVVTVHKSNAPAGNVVRQSLRPGAAFTPNQVITIWVSPGPPMTGIPNVDHMQVAQAIHILKQAGFKVTVDKVGPFNTVFNYSPSGTAPKGSTITLYVGWPGG
jgi:eukaryotic-like serine/threonine-protein kinase